MACTDLHYDNENACRQSYTQYQQYIVSTMKNCTLPASEIQSMFDLVSQELHTCQQSYLLNYLYSVCYYDLPKDFQQSLDKDFFGEDYLLSQEDFDSCRKQCPSTVQNSLHLLQLLSNFFEEPKRFSQTLRNQSKSCNMKTNNTEGESINLNKDTNFEVLMKIGKVLKNWISGRSDTSPDSDKASKKTEQNLTECNPVQTYSGNSQSAQGTYTHTQAPDRGHKSHITVPNETPATGHPDVQRIEQDGANCDIKEVDTDNLISNAQAEANSILSDAKETAQKIRAEAQEQAETIRAVAQEKSNQILASARKEAEKIQADADEYADSLRTQSRTQTLNEHHEAHSEIALPWQQDEKFIKNNFSALKDALDTVNQSFVDMQAQISDKTTYRIYEHMSELYNLMAGIRNRIDTKVYISGDTFYGYIDIFMATIAEDILKSYGIYKFSSSVGTSYDPVRHEVQGTYQNNPKNAVVLQSVRCGFEWKEKNTVLQKEIVLLQNR